VYADIAMMIGKYTKQILSMDVDETTTEIADMHIEAALVANDAGKQQTLRTTAKLNKDTKSLACAFSSVDVSPPEERMLKVMAWLTHTLQPVEQW